MISKYIEDYFWCQISVYISINFKIHEDFISIKTVFWTGVCGGRLVGLETFCESSFFIDTRLNHKLFLKSEKKKYDLNLMSNKNHKNLGLVPKFHF